MRLVWFLATVALGCFVAWVLEPDIWLLTFALTSGGAAAYRGVTLSPLPQWWRIVVGTPPTVGVFMLWVADGRVLVFLLWLLFIGGLRVALRGYLSSARR